MNHIHHHPDGIIYIRTKRGVYSATLAEFKQDYGAPFPALPEGYTERYYHPAKKHNVQNERGVEGLPLPWPEGDAILSAFDTLLAKQQARENPPKTPEEIRAEENHLHKARIEVIESKSIRAMREGLLALLPTGAARVAIEEVELEITKERAKLVT